MCTNTRAQAPAGTHTLPEDNRILNKALHRLGGADSLFAGIRALGQGRTHPIVRILLCALRAALLEKVDFADGSFLGDVPSA